jgi:CRISPR-associated protein Csx10
MQKYKVSIRLISDALIGSGEGYGALIDSDVVFDDAGIPYIPARRIKGMLRDSAEEAFEIIKIGFPSFLKVDLIKELFGAPGLTESARISIANFYIYEYEKNYKWFNYYCSDKNIGKYISKDLIINSFTNLRKQTTIADGVAKKNSLRTIRVVNKGITFSGEIEISDNNSELKKLLVLSCLNLKYIGTKRKRGLGEVECSVEGVLNDCIISELEALCKN